MQLGLEIREYSETNHDSTSFLLQHLSKDTKEGEKGGFRNHREHGRLNKSIV